MAWNLDRLTKLTQGDAWKKMSPIEQRYAMDMAYDGYYVPSMKASGREPMDRETFVGGGRNAWMFDPEYQFRSKWQDFAGQPVWHAAHGASTMTKIGIDYGHRTWHTMFTGANDSDFPPEDVPWQKTIDAWAHGYTNHVDDWLARQSESWTGKINTTGFFLNAAPSKSKLSAASGAVGEFAGELPFYMALGEGLGALAGTAWEAAGTGARLVRMGGGITGAIGGAAETGIGAANNLTRLLTATRPGSLVAQALKGASEGYVMADIKNESDHNKRMEAADWAIQSALFGMAGYAAQDLTRGLWTKMLQYGGKALANTMFEHGINRAFDNFWDIKFHPDDIRLSPISEAHPFPKDAVPRPETYNEIGQRIQANLSQSDINAYTRWLYHGMHAITDAWHPGHEHIDSFWNNSKFPIREHWRNGILYKSRFINYDQPIIVRAFSSTGEQLAQVALKPSGRYMANAIYTSWPFVRPEARGRGIASEMYKNIPSIAKSYGFQGFTSEGARTDEGHALWERLESQGVARFMGTPHDRMMRQSHFVFDWDATARDEHAEPGYYSPFGGVAGIDSQFRWTPYSLDDLNPRFMGEEQLLEAGRATGGVADIPHPDRPFTGHIEYKGQYFRYENAQQMRMAFRRARGIAQADIRRYDSVLASMGEASERWIRNESMNLFGTRAVKSLKINELHELYARYGEMINKAAEEMPQSSPEEVAKEVKRKSDQSAAEDPDYAAMRDRAKAMGFDTVSTTTEHITNANAEATRSWTQRLRDIWRNATNRTGRDSSPMAADADKDYKGMPSQALTEEHEYEPPENASASYGLAPDIRRLMRRSREANMQKVRTARQRSRRFLTDVSEREARLHSDRLAADYTRVGRRDRRTFHQRLADETTDDFVKSLENSLLAGMEDHPNTSGLYFEKPLSRFLFHWSDRKNLPDAVVDKLAREIRKPVTGTGVNVSYAQMDRASDMVMRDVIQLAKIDHVKPDGRIHVYKSNEYFSTPSIWQTKLTGEVEEHEMDLLKTILANHPQELQQMNLLVKGLLQPKRRESFGIEDWIKWNRAIDDAMVGIVKPETLAELRAASTAGTAPEATPRPRARRSRRRRAEPTGGVPT